MIFDAFDSILVLQGPMDSSETPPEKTPDSFRETEKSANRLAVVTVLLCALVMAIFPSQSDDIWIHLAVGRRFFETGHFPDPDPWIFSIPDYHRGWLDVWGMHLGAYKLYQLGGFPALVALKSLLIVAGAAAPFWLARRLSFRHAAIPMLVLLSLWVASPRFLERASLFSDMISPWVLAIVISEMVRPSRLRWLLPVLFILWTNIHPGVLTGLAFIGFATIAARGKYKEWLPVLLACIAASCVHPTGYHTLEWAIRGILGNQFAIYRQFVAEFRSPFSPDNVHAYPVTLFFLLLAFNVGALILSLRRKRIEPFEWLVFAALAYLGLSSIRFMSTAAMALPVLAASVLAGCNAKASEPDSAVWQKRHIGANVVVATTAFTLILVLASLGYDAPPFRNRHLGLGRDSTLDPVSAANVVHDLPLEGKIFNEHSFGAYLTWRWDGSPRIFFHGYVIDTAFYKDQIVAAMMDRSAFNRIMNAHDVDVVMISSRPATRSSGLPIYRELITRKDWHLIYWDGVAVVYLREKPNYANIIEKRAFRYVDPYRPEALDLGMRENPARVREEVTRALEAWPDNEGLQRLGEDVGIGAEALGGRLKP